MPTPSFRQTVSFFPSLLITFCACILSSGEAIAAPEISVLGRSIAILDGDATPRIEDNSDFGAAIARTEQIKNVFVIVNSGTSPLRIDDISVDGPEFSLSILPQSSVPSEGVTSFEITYAPNNAGTHGATVTILNNDADESPYTFSIRGTARTPEIQVLGLGVVPINAGDTTPSSGDGTDFGTSSVQQVTEREFRIVNSGEVDLTISGISISPGPFSISQSPDAIVPVGGSTAFKLRFQPTDRGSRNATITISSNDLDESSYTFAVRGAANDPEIALFGNSLLIETGDITPGTPDGTQFPTVTFRQTSPRNTYVVRNSGSALLLINSVILSDAVNFRVSTALPASILSNGSAELVIEYNPASPGIHNCAVTIANNDLDEGSYSFLIRASSIAPSTNWGRLTNGDSTPSVDEGTDFESSIIGAPPVLRSFPISNAGPGEMIIESVSFSPTGQFRTTPDVSFPVTIPAGSQFSLPIIFQPTSLGEQNATVSIQHNDPNQNPFTFAVRGTGISRRLVVGENTSQLASGDTTPSELDGTRFNSIMVGIGAPATRTWPVKNDGNVPLLISSVTSSNASDFTASISPSGSLAAGASTMLRVTFSPRSSGQKTSTITIHSNDPNSPFTFVVAGEGAARVDIEETDTSEPILTRVPWGPSLAGTYAAIISTPDANGRPTTPYAGGFDVFRLNNDGSFTASGTFLDQNIIIKGKIGSDGRYLGNTILPDGTLAVIELEAFTGADGTSRLRGTLKHNGKTWLIEAIRGLSGNIPLNMIGKYTFAIPGLQNTPDGEPSGDGVGNCTLRIDGRMTLIMTLADSNRVTMTSQISPRYQWIFSKRVLNRSGVISGVMKFRDIPNVSDFDGTVFWKQEPRASHRYFKQGFSVTRTMVGNYYRQPARAFAAIPALQHTGGNNAVFHIGSSSQGVPVAPMLLNWQPSNRLVYSGPENLRLSVNVATGRLRGQYLDRVSRSNVSIDGVVLQKQNRALGVVFNYNITGSMLIIPREFVGY